MKCVAVLFCVVLTGVVQVRAQSADEKEVTETVESFLLHLGDGDFDRVASLMAPKALVVIARERPGAAAGQAGVWTHSYQTGDEWLAGLKSSTTFAKFREPLANVKVTIDSGALAHVRADFQVVRDGKTVSHGVDQFVLARENGSWKLAAIVYTSIPAR